MSGLEIIGFEDTLDSFAESGRVSALVYLMVSSDVCFTHKKALFDSCC